MSKYTELKAKHQKEVDAFPFGFAFNQSQFNEMMAKWGLTPNDTDKIYSIGGGDISGALVMLLNENGSCPTQTETKLAQIAANFLGKQMEE